MRSLRFPLRIPQIRASSLKNGSRFSWRRRQIADLWTREKSWQAVCRQKVFRNPTPIPLRPGARHFTSGLLVMAGFTASLQIVFIEETLEIAIVLSDPLTGWDDVIGHGRYCPASTDRADFAPKIADEDNFACRRPSCREVELADGIIGAELVESLAIIGVGSTVGIAVLARTRLSAASFRADPKGTARHRRLTELMRG